jgi:hypothetical protein
MIPNKSSATMTGNRNRRASSGMSTIPAKIASRLISDDSIVCNEKGYSIDSLGNQMVKGEQRSLRQARAEARALKKGRDHRVVRHWTKKLGGTK